MMALLTTISTFLGIKASFDKVIYCGLVLYALRTKKTVAAKYAHGTFEIIATGDKTPPTLP